MDLMHGEEMSYKASNTEVLPVIHDLHHSTNTGHCQSKTVPDFLVQVAYSVAHFCLSARNDHKSEI